MLVLRRKKNESVLIGDNIRLTVVDCFADGVKLAIEAPGTVSILREELAVASRMNESAAAPDKASVMALKELIEQDIKAGQNQKM